MGHSLVGSDALNKSIKSLESFTRKLVKSSRTIEYLTRLVIFTSVFSIGIMIVAVNPFFALAVIIVVDFALVGFWIRGRRNLKELT